MNHMEVLTRIIEIKVDIEMIEEIITQIRGHLELLKLWDQEDKENIEES